MLGENDATANLAVRDLDRARRFYEDVLGLQPVDEEGGEVVTYKSGASTISVYRSEFAGTNKATAVTWQVTDIDAALREAHRVLKVGGRFLCLEFSQVKAESLSKLYDMYSRHLIPRMGQMVAGDAASYQYLIESIRQFPSQEAFLAKIRATGFGNASYRNMTGGVVALHSGWKL